MSQGAGMGGDQAGLGADTAGLARFQAGAVEVICLVDGATVFDPPVFAGLDAGVRAGRLAAAGLDAVRSDFNAYVLRHPGGVDLVDTGCGRQMGDKAGHLPRLLAALGIAPGDIGRIIFTHLHGDHVGGALAAEGARLAYPRATVLMHREEAAFWRGSERSGGQLLSLVEPELLEDGADLGFGMRLWHLPGHTPGHSGLMMEGLALVGDILHSEALQLPDPDLCPIYDEDPGQAAQTRRAALKMLAETGMVWSGSHMLGPEKFARLGRAGQGAQTERAAQAQGAPAPAYARLPLEPAQ